MYEERYTCTAFARDHYVTIGHTHVWSAQNNVQIAMVKLFLTTNNENKKS